MEKNYEQEKVNSNISHYKQANYSIRIIANEKYKGVISICQSFKNNDHSINNSTIQPFFC